MQTQTSTARTSSTASKGASKLARLIKPIMFIIICICIVGLLKIHSNKQHVICNNVYSTLSVLPTEQSYERDLQEELFFENSCYNYDYTELTKELSDRGLLYTQSVEYLLLNNPIQ